MLRELPANMCIDCPACVAHAHPCSVHAQVATIAPRCLAGWDRSCLRPVATPRLLMQERWRSKYSRRRRHFFFLQK